MAEPMSEDLARRILLGSKDTYTVDVPGIGTFKCKRRSFFDDARVEVEARGWLEQVGDDPRRCTEQAMGYARVFGTVKVSVVDWPQGVKVEDLDLDDLVSVYGAIEAEEASFRVAKQDARKGPAQGPSVATPATSVQGMGASPVRKRHSEPNP